MNKLNLINAKSEINNTAYKNKSILKMLKLQILKKFQNKIINGNE